MTDHETYLGSTYGIPTSNPSLMAFMATVDMDSRDSGERRTNYRPYLETYARYLAETGQYDDAKKIFADRAVFSDAEAQSAVRDIETVQAYRMYNR
jgi:hypothetical protein